MKIVINETVDKFIHNESKRPDNYFSIIVSDIRRLIINYIPLFEWDNIPKLTTSKGFIETNFHRNDDGCYLSCTYQKDETKLFLISEYQMYSLDIRRGISKGGLSLIHPDKIDYRHPKSRPDLIAGNDGNFYLCHYGDKEYEIISLDDIPNKENDKQIRLIQSIRLFPEGERVINNFLATEDNEIYVTSTLKAYDYGEGARVDGFKIEGNKVKQILSITPMLDCEEPMQLDSIHLDRRGNLFVLSNALEYSSIYKINLKDPEEHYFIYNYDDDETHTETFHELHTDPYTGDLYGMNWSGIYQIDEITGEVNARILFGPNGHIDFSPHRATSFTITQDRRFIILVYIHDDIVINRYFRFITPGNNLSDIFFNDFVGEDTNIVNCGDKYIVFGFG